jgi:hypothetical protein
MPIYLNGKLAATGKPGSYLALERVWSEGDAISFTLPAALRAVPYVGVDQVPDYARYAVFFGPILLAAVGSGEVRLRAERGKPPADFLKQLRSIPGPSLHYSVEHNPGVEFMPYWQVDEQPFTCFPAVALHA